MTPLQAKILRFVTAYIQEHYYAPLQSEIADAVGCRFTHMPEYLEKMHKRGLLIKGPGWRNIKLRPDAPRVAA